MSCICGHDLSDHESKDGPCLIECDCPEFIRDGGGDGPEGLKRLLSMKVR